MSGAPLPYDYIRDEGRAGRMGARLMAIVADGGRQRLYLAPTRDQEAAAEAAKPEWTPDTRLHGKCRVNVSNYGMDTFGDLFTPRQLVALTTLSDLIGEAREQIRSHALTAGVADDSIPLRGHGTGATAYAEAVGVYLAFCVDKASLTNTTQASWQKDPDRLTQGFARQAIPMVWDYAEANPLSDAGGGFGITSHAVGKVLERFSPSASPGLARQQDATSGADAKDRVVSTDPPYYDNISYADLSDYFYLWLRRSLRVTFPSMFATLAAPKAEELVATPYRHGTKRKAEAFFLHGMTQAMHALAEQSHPACPVTIFYAFKQAETKSAEGTSSTGWETFLAAVMDAGFAISGTWPMRTELTSNLKKNFAALASSIVLVCRKRTGASLSTTRREFLAALKSELPAALAYLQRSNIAPVDLAQAAIGPGMAIYTRYDRVLESDGSALPVRVALALINQVLDEVLAEQEGDFDADTRWALAWFEQSGFEDGEYGTAETLSTAKNTSVQRLEQTGMVVSRGGKVHLLAPSDLSDDWDLDARPQLTVWEMVHHLIRMRQGGGEQRAALLMGKLGAKAEAARELAYRLYAICERKKRAAEALTYNALVQSWPEISRLTREQSGPSEAQSGLFNEGKD